MKKIPLPLEKLDPVFEKLGNLATLHRILIAVGVLILIIGPMVWLSFLPKLEKIDQLNTEFEELDQKLVTARAKAKKLPKLKKELEAKKEDFAVATKKLPQAKDIPTLLAAISASGQETGLDFVLFKPKPETEKDFYAEIPVSLSVLGSYYNVAEFFDKISKLPRIVNFRDLVMTPSGKRQVITTSCTAVTYMFLEKEK